MASKTETRHLTTSRLIKITGDAILLEYIITCVHHVEEGLGFVFGFRLNSLLAPLTFGIPLLITLGFLYLYKKTSSWLVLGVFSITTLLWWVAGLGLQDGFYNHTLNVLLYLAGVPLAIMRMVYPTYTPPTSTSVLTIPCDGIQFHFCTLTPSTVLYEGTGMLTFVVACWLIVAVFRLIRAQWSNKPASAQTLPRAVLVGVSLGLLASFATLPLLGSFMSTGRLSFLIAALPIMSISVLALVVAMAWLRRKHPATT